MLGTGALRRLGLGLVLAVTTAVGMGGCVLAPFPGPLAVGPPVVVAPRPVIIGPRGHGYYRGGYHGGNGRHWR
jgi:hypothetical protein